MDPLSVIASVVGLLTAAGTVSSILSNIKSRINDVPRLMDHVLSEVKEVEISLSAMHKFLTEISSAPIRRIALIQVDQLIATLTESVLTFSELEEFVKPLAERSEISLRERVKWFWKEDAVSDIMQRLQRHKSSLSLMLNIVQCESDLEAEKSRVTLQNSVEQLLESNRDISRCVLESNREILRLLRNLEDTCESQSILTECFRNGSRNQLANKDEGETATITANRWSSDDPNNDRNFDVTAFRFAFESELNTSRVYKRTQLYESDASFSTSAVRTQAWSIFSGLSLAEVSTISVVALPLYLPEISNSQCYNLGGDPKPSFQSTEFETGAGFPEPQYQIRSLDTSTSLTGTQHLISNSRQTDTDDQVLSLTIAGDQKSIGSTLRLGGVEGNGRENGREKPRHHNGQNEAPSATVPNRMSEDLWSDAGNVFKDTQIQMSSVCDASPVYTQESTRIESSTRSDGSPHDTNDPETIPILSPFYGAPLSYNYLKRRDSPTLIRKISPDGHMTILLDLTGDNQACTIVPERPDHPDFIPSKQDHLGHCYNEAYRSDSTLGYSDHSESILSVEDHLEPILEGRDDLRRNLNQQDQQRRLHQETRLHDILSRNLQIRARAYEKRSQLRQLRSEISNAVEAFIKLIREEWTQDSRNNLALEASLQNLQDARNKYSPMEDSYNALEEQLDRMEYEAKELEERILKSQTPAADFDIDSQSSSASQDDSDASEIVREVGHPLYEAYLSRLGDAQLCREALLELLTEHDNFLRVRERVGIKLSLDDQVTLGNFPAAEAKLTDELEHLEADIEHLRLKCVQVGLFGEDRNENEGNGDGEGEVEEINLLEPPNGSVYLEAEYNKFPLLLEKPEEKDENKSKVLLTDFKEGDIGDRITCWLLHKLRSSALEIELLARFNGGLDCIADTEKWQEEVLEFWFFDGANLPPSAYEVEPTLIAFVLSSCVSSPL